MIHTIKLQNEIRNPRCATGSTRRSETRRYAACLVATSTERSVQIAAEKLAANKAALVEAETKLATLEAERSMTADAAREQNKVENRRWYDEGKIFDLETAIADEAGSPRWGVNWKKVRETAKAQLIANGYVDPYDPANTWGLCVASDLVNDLRYKVENHCARAVGRQCVVSWHLTAANAQKALGARDAAFFCERGDAVAVRTDIEVRETSKKTRKVKNQSCPACPSCTILVPTEGVGGELYCPTCGHSEET